MLSSLILAGIIVLLLIGIFIWTLENLPGHEGSVSGIGSLVMLILFVIFAVLHYFNSYKSGQIDALTGKIKYHLVTNENMTVEWERKTDAERR